MSAPETRTWARRGARVRKKPAAKAPRKRLAAEVVLQHDQVPLVLLDANVLLPLTLRVVFLDLADAGLIRVHWTEEILDEVSRNLPKLCRIAPADVSKARQTMVAAFPDAMVSGWERWKSYFEGKTDTKDAHVAAAAMHLHQSRYKDARVFLISQNLKDLPAKAFVGTKVTPVRPGHFLAALLKTEPQVVGVMDQTVGRMTRPKWTREDLLEGLDGTSCGSFALALAKAWNLVPEGP